MAKLSGKNILIGICAGIAAYKTCELVRLLKKQGANVKVILSDNAANFVSPLVLATLSENKVYTSQFDYSDYDIEHISLAFWADMFVIAPLSANTLSKIANGICDNLLTSVICAYNKAILLVPAMNNNMYENKIIQENLIKLKDLNYSILEPETGFLACGVHAKGRMPEPETILDKTIKIFEEKDKNKKIVITAGGTKENIDPVRFVGNYSSGKMGIAIADEAFRNGYEVTLISTVVVKDKRYNIVNVNSAIEMLEAVKDEFKTADCLIMAAAVADFRPIRVESQKIKKGNKDKLVIEMVKNPDILQEIGKIKSDNQLVVGFCAESEKLLQNAKQKLIDKNVDYIVANDISRTDTGFNSDFNEVIVISKDKDPIKINKATKQIIAKNIIKTCVDSYFKV